MSSAVAQSTREDVSLEQRYSKIFTEYREGVAPLVQGELNRGALIALRDRNGYFHMSGALFLFNPLVVMNFERFGDDSKRIYGSNLFTSQGSQQKKFSVNESARRIEVSSDISLALNALPKGSLPIDMVVEKAFIGGKEVSQALREEEEFYHSLSQHYDLLGAIGQANENQWIKFINQYKVRLIS